MNVLASYDYEVSLIVVSLDTRDRLRECINSALTECLRLPDGAAAEVLVVDNGSRDGSAVIVASEFAASAVPVRLFRSEVNLGVGAANNLAIEEARGRYIVLLDIGASLHKGTLRRAILHMDANPMVGVGGARLLAQDGACQPSARSVHTVWSDALAMTGVSAGLRDSSLLGSPDRTSISPDQPANVAWVSGAFSILRREALMKAGLFDPAFFLYNDTADLCRRVRAAGFRIFYWPDLVVTLSEPEPEQPSPSPKFSEATAQAALWRMRSTLLYNRKHHGVQTWAARWLEEGIYIARRLRNRASSDPARRERAEEAHLLRALMRQAWKETQGGRVSPQRPW
jgi:GT2 family glycosyltransferase